MSIMDIALSTLSVCLIYGVVELMRSLNAPLFPTSAPSFSIQLDSATLHSSHSEREHNTP